MNYFVWITVVKKTYMITKTTSGHYEGRCRFCILVVCLIASVLKDSNLYRRNVRMRNHRFLCPNLVGKLLLIRK